MTFGVRHCCGMEERKEGTLMMVAEVFFQTLLRLAALLLPVFAG